MGGRDENPAKTIAGFRRRPPYARPHRLADYDRAGALTHTNLIAA